MARLRRSKYLTCFYCNGKTSKVYDGKTTQFDCPKCDATNYLDKDGEITDPPVASTTSRATSSGTQYAIPTRSSPQPKTTAANSIFCDTCLKNQHLFTSSLAQYLPDDPSDPDYERLERGYYRYRTNLEQRYPQVCPECEPKVLESLRQARYTARTDHLRRKIEDSKRGREVQRSWLSLVQKFGRWLWLAGPALQLLWQATVVYNFALSRELLGEDVWYGTPLQQVGRHLPGQEGVITASIAVTGLSLWWNPRLVQTVRGFTKHLVGISTWYTFQIMILLVRIMFRQAAKQVPTTTADFSLVAAAHLFMAFITFYLYLSAARSIRTDMTRVFGKDAPSQVLRPPPPRTTAVKPAREDTMSMSAILDEVLASDVPQPRSLHQTSSPLPLLPSNRALNPHPQPPRADLSFGSLNLAEDEAQSSQGTVQYESEMDWVPTSSKHRAFNTYNPNAPKQPLGFGQIPVEENKGPFWYKVPPAPTTPAQRLYNPPSAPRLHASPITPKENVTFRSSASKNPFQNPFRENPPRKEVDFRDSSFFPPSEKADPRNALTDMFGGSFSLGDEPSSQASHDPTKPNPPPTPAAIATRNAELKKASLHVRLMELAVLVVCLLAWFHSTRTPHEYTSYVTLGSAGLCALIALRVTGEAVQDLNRQRKLGGTGPAGAVAAVVAVAAGAAELLCASRLAFILWAAAAAQDAAMAGVEGPHRGLPLADCGPLGTCMNMGAALIGVMVVHQLCGVVF